MSHRNNVNIQICSFKCAEKGKGSLNVTIVCSLLSEAPGFLPAAASNGGPTSNTPRGEIA